MLRCTRYSALYCLAVHAVIATLLTSVKWNLNQIKSTSNSNQVEFKSNQIQIQIQIRLNSNHAPCLGGLWRVRHGVGGANRLRWARRYLASAREGCP